MAENEEEHETALGAALVAGMVAAKIADPALGLASLLAFTNAAIPLLALEPTECHMLRELRRLLQQHQAGAEKERV